ncbi:MAG: cysteine desulfurase [Alphaproteobacteria bacterium]
MVNRILPEATAIADDIAACRADFPILQRTVHGQPLAFLDSAASAQKPRQVLMAMQKLYENEYANVHRGAYLLSEQATAAYEGARDTVRRFLNARKRQEIIFTRGATESINLVAATFGRAFLQAGDEIIVSGMEHHSNIVPWQMLRDEKGLVLKVIPVADDGSFRYESFEPLLSPRTRMVAITQVSNVLGTVVPVARIAAAAHAVGAKILVDGCQAVTHMTVDVQEINCDFYAFSGHKLYGPTGIGVLYGREALLKAMPPYQTGGDMITSVTFEKTSWAPLPAKFEAGTPAIAEAAGLAAAIDYVNAIGMDRIAAHEQDLLAYATERLSRIPGLTLIGTAPGKTSVLSFVLDGAHPHDIATILDRSGVAIRAGHHCAQPLMERFQVPATARASFALYNTRDDVDALVLGLEKVREIFA